MNDAGGKELIGDLSREVNIPQEYPIDSKYMMWDQNRNIERKSLLIRLSNKEINSWIRTESKVSDVIEIIRILNGNLLIMEQEYPIIVVQEKLLNGNLVTLPDTKVANRQSSKTMMAG